MGENATATVVNVDIGINSLVSWMKRFRQTIRQSRNLAQETDTFLEKLGQQLQVLNGAKSTPSEPDEEDKEKHELKLRLKELEEELEVLVSPDELSDLVREILDREPDANLRQKFEKLVNLIQFSSAETLREIGAMLT